VIGLIITAQRKGAKIAKDAKFLLFFHHWLSLRSLRPLRLCVEHLEIGKSRQPHD
jgi:hypothetical protein